MKNTMNAARFFLLALFLLTAPPVFAAADDMVTPVGAYSSMRQDDEHCHGYDFQVWRIQRMLYGVMRACDGVIGGIKAGAMENLAFDKGTERFSFIARLSLGADVVAEGKEIPTQDVFFFTGKLTPSLLVGTLRHTDQAIDRRVTVTEKIRLKKEKDLPPAYATYQEWQGMVGQLLAQSGPKW